MYRETIALLLKSVIHRRAIVSIVFLTRIALVVHPIAIHQQITVNHALKEIIVHPRWSAIQLQDPVLIVSQIRIVQEAPRTVI